MLAAPRPSSAALRRNRTVRRIALRWRQLTGGTTRGLDPNRRTLVACSGGADSTALALALWAACPKPSDTLVIAHVVHDLRPETESLADRDAVRSLAQTLSLPFIETRVEARGKRQRNLEASARQERYRALASLAVDHACSFVATAHHADDQLESVLMAIARGSALRGLRGIAPARRLDRAATLIRPALACTRNDLRALCTAASIPWREDATNADSTRLRAALRVRVVPELLAIAPAAAASAARAVAHAREGHALVAASARALAHNATIDTKPLSFSRALLRGAPRLVLGEVVRRAVHHLVGTRSRDRLTSRALDPALRAIRSPSGELRVLALAGAELRVTRDRVTITPRVETPRRRAASKSQS